MNSQRKLLLSGLFSLGGVLIRHFRKDSQKSSSEVHLKPSESEHRSIDKVHHVHNENTTSGYVMGDLGSVHVQKDFRVNWDRESQSYSESTG
ncbi:hypothetical protein N7478_006606 [Penicillium angulare]|uniref:uncharacterized protein n=1 Tax=Penicillium angulare TaxID=116970 RepID=UPI0025421025|nr:uncharacterized protein N7478_006606 [Penicillium angulare]KAJ5281234.1 hypothetical protein N7478_006606 [Penicillium angulare]